MKIYNLDIDTSKPINLVVQMQQNETGLLKLNVTNDSKSIRNLSCIVYDGETEVPSTDNGFKIDMGKNEKVVKVEAKSEPIMSEMNYTIKMGTGSNKSVVHKVCQIPEGVYSQDEFKLVVDELMLFTTIATAINALPTASSKDKINISYFVVNGDGSYYFLRSDGQGDSVIVPKDEPIIVTGDVEMVYNTIVKRTGYEIGTITYPAFGEHTDYQLDTTIRPSVNAPYDGDYTEPLTEVEVAGMKFVPTTLTIDGVEYKVLAEEQATPDPEEPVEPTEG